MTRTRFRLDEDMKFEFVLKDGNASAVRSLIVTGVRR